MNMQAARIIFLVLILAYFAVALRSRPEQVTPASATPTATGPARPAPAITDWRQQFSDLWAQAEKQGYVVAFEPWPAGGGGLLMVYNSGTLVATTSAPYERLVLTLERLVN